MNYNCAAFTIFDRIEFADKPEESMSSPCSMGAVPRQAKAFLPRIPLVSTIKQRPDYRGFFVSAVIATSDNDPAWDSCNVNTGHRQPLGARLANLVEVSRNLFSQSGRMTGMRNRINPSCALGSGNRMEQWTKELIFSCPFEELSLK